MCVKGRFKCQVLLDDSAVIAAMAYAAHGCANAANVGCARAAVDLNPVRANLCDTLEALHHTSARKRLTEIEAEPGTATHALAPVLGIRRLSVLRMSQAEYLGLVDSTGRQIRADKHGALVGPAPRVSEHMGAGSEDFAQKVMALRSGCSRAVGDIDSLVEKAKAMGQCWLRGVGTARALASTMH